MFHSAWLAGWRRRRSPFTPTHLVLIVGAARIVCAALGATGRKQLGAFEFGVLFADHPFQAIVHPADRPVRAASARRSADRSRWNRSSPGR
jgi:hypothetical protein